MMKSKLVEPVTLSGWYGREDGTVTEYTWRAGQLVEGRTVLSWALVPTREMPNRWPEEDRRQ